MTTTASAQDNATQVLISENGRKGDPGDAASAGSGFNQVRKSLIDNPLCHLFKTNKLVEASAPTGTDSDVTWLHSTTGTYIDRYGIVKTAAIDTPREESKGFLNEDNATNLLLRSEEFDDAAWGKFGCTITTNAATAPDLTVTADKIVESAVNEDHRINQSFTISSTGSVTISLFVEAAERDFIQIVPDSAVFGTAHVNFDLSTGTVTVNSGALSASIIELASGRFRISATFNATTTGVSGVFISLADSGSMGRLDSYLGDGSSGLYVWGAQSEEQSLLTPSSYIQTVASTATRTADVVSIDYINNFVSGEPHSIFLKINPFGAVQGSGRVLETTGGATSLFISTNDKGNIFTYLSMTSTTEAVESVLFVFDGINASIYVDGNLDISGAASAIVADSSSIRLFDNAGGIRTLSANIKDFRIYDLALNANEAEYLS